MDVEPLVSIIIPAFDDEDVIAGALESCVRQTLEALRPSRFTLGLSAGGGGALRCLRLRFVVCRCRTHCQRTYDAIARHQCAIVTRGRTPRTSSANDIELRRSSSLSCVQARAVKANHLSARHGTCRA